MRALILYMPDGPACRRRVAQLRDELRWRRFDVDVERGNPAERRDVSSYRLVVLAFAAIGLPGLPTAPLGRIGALVHSLEGLEGRAVALLSVSPLGGAGGFRPLTRGIERAGARVVAARSVSAVGSHGGVIDLAAECMTRIPR